MHIGVHVFRLVCHVSFCSFAANAGQLPRPWDINDENKFVPKELSADLLARVKGKYVPHHSWEKVWESNQPLQLSAVHSNTISIWSPKELDGKSRGFMKKNRVRVCFGHTIIEGNDITKTTQKVNSKRSLASRFLDV